MWSVSLRDWNFGLLIVFQYRARDKPWYPLGHGKELPRFSIHKF